MQLTPNNLDQYLSQGNPKTSQEIADYFNLPLRTQKWSSYKMWKESIKLRLHPSENNYKKIVDIYYNINPRLNKQNKQKRVFWNEETKWFEIQ